MKVYKGRDIVEMIDELSSVASSTDKLPLLDEEFIKLKDYENELKSMNSKIDRLESLSTHLIPLGVNK